MACRTRRDKHALVRIVRQPDGTISIDRSGGSLPGRGAYLCLDHACVDTALRRSSLERALRRPLPIELKIALERGDATAFATAHSETPRTTHGGTDGP